MAYLLKTDDGCSYIVRENEKDGTFVVEASGLDSHNCSFNIGDVLSTDTLHHFFNNHKRIYQAELISEFVNKEVSVRVYKTFSGYYQVVANGVIRHPDVDADGAMRAISIYSQA